MKNAWLRLLLGGLLLLTGAGLVRAAEEPQFTRTEDVIYGRKFGTALTMDVITPKTQNGAAIIWVISGGWFSSHDGINPAFCGEFLKRGYTVFAVVHGSQPKFTIPEAIGDLNRAVRFIRTHAKDYKIDPDRLGITGGSAGGHLSLMQGTAGDKGKADAKDPVEHASSRVQAVACFFPPTDFLNWGEKDKDILHTAIGGRLSAPFDFHELKDGKFVPITDEKTQHEWLRRISPISHVSAESPPTLIIHGDKDDVVPIQQAEIFVAKMKAAGVPVELVVKEGAKHGWPDMGKDLVTIADWFDKYLKKKD